MSITAQRQPVNSYRQRSVYIFLASIKERIERLLIVGIAQTEIFQCDLCEVGCEEKGKQLFSYTILQIVRNAQI